MNMKQGDLKPDLTITCTSNGAVVDLTTASSVQVVARRAGASSPLWTRTATGSNLGVVTYSWQAGDTDTVGIIFLEVLVTWPGSKPQRFPAVSYLTVEVESNLTT